MLQFGKLEMIGGGVDERLKITTGAGDADAQTLYPYQQVVEVDSTLGTLTLSLPNVADARGRLYSITALKGATKTVTVQDQDESYDWAGDISLDADDDRVLLYSDGKRWWVLCDMFT